MTNILQKPPLPAGEGWGEGREQTSIHHRQSTVTARALRVGQTDAEKLFWNHVKAKRFEGYKFKRQVPVGRYIADFMCFEKGVIVEIDGGQHNESKKDEMRTSFLVKEGYEVVRFWNNDVLSNIEGVLSSLSLTLSRRERGQAGRIL